MHEEESLTAGSEATRDLFMMRNIKLFRHLQDKRMTLTDLSEKLGAEKLYLKEHLERLKSEGLVREKHEGGETYYSLSMKTMRVLHPEKVRFRLLFSFSISLVVMAALLILAVWMVRGGTDASACTYCSDPVLDTYLPMMSTILGIFGLVLLAYSFKELQPNKSLKP